MSKSSKISLHNLLIGFIFVGFWAHWLSPYISYCAREMHQKIASLRFQNSANEEEKSRKNFDVWRKKASRKRLNLRHQIAVKINFSCFDNNY